MGSPDHRGEIADQENRRVPQILKMLQLAQHHGVAQMNIGRRGIHAQLHAQWLARRDRLFELRLQLILANDFRGAFRRYTRTVPEPA